ncbi:similar to Saccharomyces cerevisiae YML004C GLO1 Monomeric glyoxalase I [Maudiozyma saulgeensis]|uniref:Lactoylglutathione lyase n=1 Tax=Maudiozyma saulgeensis TaxID=1789683 RepID=A0A1X7RAK8_9SACH|nr:similar to Saccharomyces cerevisiae YML004C GLO1 Monomeric glyoxalase I [Kazachstania saulgeensis]
MSYETVIQTAQNDTSLTLNHTCVRVKDPKVSVEFYTEKLGMKLLKRKDFPEMKFSLYFLAYPRDDLPIDPNGEVMPFGVPGILELTHNWGTENDSNFKVSNGNEEPHRGFGHICITTKDINAMCEKLESKNVNFKKRLVDGRQKDIAFILDPDNYWIELCAYNPSESGKNVNDYRLNHTMIRIKDPAKTLPFYENVLGMKVIEKSVHENGKFTLYFLGYGLQEGESKRSTQGMLEITHNWGTETDSEFQYHNGNEKPQGYGHICIASDDPEKMCKEIEEKYGDKITWSPKYNHGKMKNLAFIKDPDNYSIEIIPRGIVL